MNIHLELNQLQNMKNYVLNDLKLLIINQDSNDGEIT